MPTLPRHATFFHRRTHADRSGGGLGASTMNAGERMALYCLRNPDVGRSRNGGHHLTIDFDEVAVVHRPPRQVGV